MKPFWYRLCVERDEHDWKTYEEEKPAPFLPESKLKFVIKRQACRRCTARRDVVTDLPNQ